MVEGTPPGDALPQPPQRATPARKGARCGAGAGSPHPLRPHPGHTGRGTLAARSRGRAAGGATAPDTRRPSQRWQAPPPGTAPHHPHGTQPPQGMQAKGTVLGPHTHTPSPTARGWRTPTARPVGGQSREGERLTSDAPHNSGRHPPGDALPPPPQRATPARKGARCGAGAGSRRPHRPHPGHTGCGTLAARSRGRAAGGGTAPDTRRPSQRWQANPHGDGPPPPPRHAAPTGHAGQGDSVGPPHSHTRAHSTWVADPNSPPSGRPVEGGTAPDLSRPSQWWKATPTGTPFRHPHSEQRRPARAHAVGPVLDPHARTNRTRDTRVAEPWLPAPEDGRPGEGQRLTPNAPHNGGSPPPPGDGPPPPPRYAAPTGHAGQGDSDGPPHPHNRAYSTWVADPNSPPSGQAVMQGTAPDLRRPSQWWKAPPPGTPFDHPHSEQRRPARAHAVGPVLGPHARTDRTRDTRVAEPRLPAPEDGRPGERQRLTPDAPHNGGRPAPPGTDPHHPRGMQPPQGMQAKGTVLGRHTHTPAPTARGWRTPTARPVGGQSGEGQRLTSDAPHNGGRHPPRGRPSATPTASIAGPQGRTLWGRCWVPTPAPTAPGTHGSRNPGYPHQRTGGRGRDSA